MRHIQTTILDIDGLLSLPRLLPEFIFRGQENSQWKLTTSLERALGNGTNPPPHLKKLELSMLQRFRQRRHLYTGTSIDETDVFEWLAELQHYGAPTRLLDFSFSPYIAAYFATSNAKAESAIWAINYSDILDNLKSDKVTSSLNPISPKGNDLLNREMTSKTWDIASNYVVPLEATKPNIRITRQQGLFLAQIATRDLNGRLTFEDCLASTFGSSKIPLPQSMPFDELRRTLAIQPKPHMVQINIPLDLAGEIRRHLSCMGLSAESLFPGLEGLAQSLFPNSRLEGHA